MVEEDLILGRVVPAYGKSCDRLTLEPLGEKGKRVWVFFRKCCSLLDSLLEGTFYHFLAVRDLGAEQFLWIGKCCLDGLTKISTIWAPSSLLLSELTSTLRSTDEIHLLPIFGGVVELLLLRAGFVSCHSVVRSDVSELVSLCQNVNRSFNLNERECDILDV